MRFFFGGKKTHAGLARLYSGNDIMEEHREFTVTVY